METNNLTADTNSSATEQPVSAVESSSDLDTKDVDPAVESSSDLVATDTDTTETTSATTGSSRWVTWLFFLGYGLVAIIASWYTQTTGKTSETLTNWLVKLDERLTVKQRKLFRLLSKWWEKLCKKKQA